MPAAGRPAPVRRRVRLARGPVTIGEPAAVFEARLAAAEPYRPDTIADGGGAFGLTVRAASVRGLYKRYTGGPRQDDLCLRLHAPDTLIAAVADGVPGRPRSDLGAALAVRHATAAVARQLDDGVRDRLGRGVRSGRVGVRRGAAAACGDPDAGVEAAAASLATTLVVAAVRGSDVELAAVGDSPAFVLAGKEYDALVGEPDPLMAWSAAASRRFPGRPARRRWLGVRSMAETCCCCAPTGWRCPWPGAPARWAGRSPASWPVHPTSSTSRGCSTSAGARTTTIAP